MNKFSDGLKPMEYEIIKYIHSYCKENKRTQIQGVDIRDHFAEYGSIGKFLKKLTAPKEDPHSSEHYLIAERSKLTNHKGEIISNIGQKDNNFYRVNDTAEMMLDNRKYELKMYKRYKRWLIITNIGTAILIALLSACLSRIGLI